jgi:D-arabinose 1-dehydrogenase-like Zn-dependent alcohol dehydrogenase
MRYAFFAGNCPLPLAATYTCSGLTAFSAVRKCSLAMQGATSSPTGEGRSLLIIGAGGLGLHGAKNATFCAIFNVKCIILPRQARDKHRENSKKSGVFRRDQLG